MPDSTTVRDREDALGMAGNPTEPHPDMSSDSAGQQFLPLRKRISWIWFVIMIIVIALIWGNSTLNADESSTISLGALDTIQEFFASIGLPYEWLTNYIIRKTAHFLEYMVLALVVMQVFRPQRPPHVIAPIVITAVILIAIPCLDETIQLFSTGRTSKVTDVLIDLGGALLGVLLTVLISWLVRRHRARKRQAIQH